MVEVEAKSVEESCEAAPDTRRRAPEMDGDLGRIETGDVSKRQQGAVVSGQPAEDPPQVDDGDPVPRILVTDEGRGFRDIDVADPPLTAHGLPPFVRGDSDKPGTDLRGIADGVDPAPRDRPR